MCVCALKKCVIQRTSISLFLSKSCTRSDSTDKGNMCACVCVCACKPSCFWPWHPQAGRMPDVSLGKFDWLGHLECSDDTIPYVCVCVFIYIRGPDNCSHVYTLDVCAFINRFRSILIYRLSIVKGKINIITEKETGDRKEIQANCVLNSWIRLKSRTNSNRLFPVQHPIPPRKFHGYPFS